MTLATISDKGQLTLPAQMRKRLGIKSRSKVEVDIRDGEIIIRPARTIRDVAGVFADYAKGKPTDWAAIRDQMETAIAEEVAHEGVE